MAHEAPISEDDLRRALTEAAAVFALHGVQIDIENLVAAHKGSFDLDWIRAEWQSLGPLDDPRLQRLMELAS